VPHLTDTDLLEARSLCSSATSDRYTSPPVQQTVQMELLKSTLLHTERNNKTRNVAASDMNLTERRFKTFLYYLRLVGIPLNITSPSAANTVYNGVIIVCFYITTISIYMDSYVHRHELDYVMRKIRVLLGMNLVTWIHLSIR
jgi:hypothetical protein